MTENEIILFKHEEFGEIRTMNIDGEPWFVGKDVCGAFGDKNHIRSMRRVDEIDKQKIELYDSMNRKQSATVINESGLYDLFGLPWVKQIVQLFNNFGWALYIVGIVVALFDFAIESQNGRGDPKALALNIIKGFFAVNLFCTVPVK